VVGVSASFESGEFSALAGPSGSGKTTLLNLIAALEEPTDGRVLFDGRDLGSLSENEKARFRLENLGVIFQAFNLIPVLSAFENVEYALILRGVQGVERRRRSLEALAFVGLSDCTHRRPNKLSGGQQQRVAIARALAAGPKLILADEPTANLDSKTAASILDLMGKVNREKGTTFIFSSHDSLVLSRARRIVHLRDGMVETDESQDGNARTVGAAAS
jgi:putative ABC transport system ATP-binding protein